MKTPRLVPVAVVASFAVAVALVAINLTQAAPSGPKTTDVAKRGADAAPAESPAAHPAIGPELSARDEAELAAMFTVVGKPKPGRAAPARDAQGERGKQVYLGLCYACHQPDGRGLPGAFPMLAQSDFMLADRTRAIHIVLNGLSGPVTVNGQTINSAMPPQKTTLTDEQIADVLTYVFNAWENPGGVFTAAEVAAIRGANP